MADWPYNTANWQRLRKLHLSAFPLYEGCLPHRITTANTVDHRLAIG
jgi:5-methylcytosine-specific restriction protein A